MPVGIDRSMMLLSIVSVLYCLLAIALAWKGPHRWQTYLLAVQLLLLLPGFYVFLRKSPGPERGPLPVPVPRWVLAAAAVVLGGVFVYFAPQWRFGVTLPDETAYWFQAKIFQTGSWCVSAEDLNQRVRVIFCRV